MRSQADTACSKAPIDPDRAQIALRAADCGSRVLAHFERQHPRDDRPRKAIEAARAWARGKITCGEARRAAIAAHASARSAEGAARAAARAAGHAAATAHMAGHARAAESYACKAEATCPAGRACLPTHPPPL